MSITDYETIVHFALKTTEEIHSILTECWWGGEIMGEWSIENSNNFIKMKNYLMEDISLEDLRTRMLCIEACKENLKAKVMLQFRFALSEKTTSKDQMKNIKAKIESGMKYSNFEELCRSKENALKKALIVDNIDTDNISNNDWIKPKMKM